MSHFKSDSQDDGAVFKALADDKRRRILDYLKERPRTTGELCSHFSEVDRCTIIMHLDILRKADLVITKKEGRFKWNYLDAIPIRRIYNRWIGKYADYAVEMLERFKNDIEGNRPEKEF